MLQSGKKSRVGLQNHVRSWVVGSDTVPVSVPLSWVASSARNDDSLASFLVGQINRGSRYGNMSFEGVTQLINSDAMDSSRLFPSLWGEKSPS